MCYCGAYEHKQTVRHIVNESNRPKFNGGIDELDQLTDKTLSS